MGELKFNPDLCVFEEDEDPLHSSLHLEDLKNLSGDMSIAPSSTSCCSCSDETSDVNSADTHGNEKQFVLDFDESESTACETLTTKQESSALVEEKAKEATSLVPDASSLLVCCDTSPPDYTRTYSQDVDSESHTRILDADEMVPAPPSFEDDDFFSCGDSTNVSNNENESPSLHYNMLQKHAELEIKRIHSRKVLEMLEKENQEHIAKAVPENEIQKLKRSASRSWRLRRMSSHTFGSKKNYVGLSTNQDNHDVDNHIITRQAILQKNKILRDRCNDVTSSMSSSVSLASRLSKALTPQWIKKRKEKNRQEKKAVAKARALMFLRNNKRAHEKSSIQDDDSIMTSVPMQNEQLMGDIIENIDKLESISLHSPYYCNRQGSFSRRMSQCSDSLSGISKPLSSSVASSDSSRICCNKTGGVSQQYPNCLNHIVRMHSAPIIREKKDMVANDSDFASLERRHSLQPIKMDGNHVTFTNEDRQTVSKGQNDGDIPCPSISWKHRQSVEIKCGDDDEEDSSHVSLTSSIGSKSVSAIHALPTHNEATRELSQAPSTSPNLLRTYSLPSPYPHSHGSSTSSNSLPGSQYASHLLCCHHSSCTASVSSASMSSSSCRRSPTTSSMSSVAIVNSDCNSTASAGFSVSSSTYTALSNSISYKDPCAKPSKMIKRSNLDVSGHGDGDIWVERIFVSKRTGKRKIFFVSVATGRKVRSEPPTGASKVLYQDDLQELRRLEAEEEEETKRKKQGNEECISPVSLSSGLAAC